MKHVTFAPGEVIVEAGHLGTSMYFMDAGCCRYIGEDRTVIELGDGDFFGESAFIITLRIMSTAGVYIYLLFYVYLYT
jgi:CRP-like cAMP-binding protein